MIVRIIRNGFFLVFFVCFCFFDLLEQCNLHFIFHFLQDYRIGLGITSIEMNVGNIKVSDRRSFDLTTPYRIFRYCMHTEMKSALTPFPCLCDYHTSYCSN